MSKGSRPIRVVSSVEGLALKVGTGSDRKLWNLRKLVEMFRCFDIFFVEEGE